MKKKYTLLTFFIVLITLCIVFFTFTEKIPMEKIPAFINNFIQTQSFAWAKSSEVYNKDILRDFCDKYFDNPFTETEDILIIKDSIDFKSIGKKLDEGMFSQKMYKKTENKAAIQVELVIDCIAKIENKKITYLNEPKKMTVFFDLSYSYADKKFYIFYTTFYNHYYILEKDLPILLQRLSITN